ncbi:MAG TPA: hypothetical protein VFV73_31675 [Streptosporangiaceae bacterium]|nr:hypothetical protein [Streptosporangiaceae bacterium]
MAAEVYTGVLYDALGLGYPVEPGPEARGQHAPTALDIVVREL